MGIGNVFRHEYDTIVHRIVWTTAPNNLPALLAVVEAEIEKLPIPE